MACRVPSLLGHAMLSLIRLGSFGAVQTALYLHGTIAEHFAVEFSAFSMHLYLHYSLLSICDRAFSACETIENIPISISASSHFLFQPKLLDLARCEAFFLVQSPWFW